ncbi:hypothetical protein CCMSSC00406_0010128 [Pleurotus cornucopiae]|uniref:Uncharacterized protein n=1 Tax=Pleurotus cornucopiae TaxID=5321 RepID=A0ACB7IIQ6_PLECO|nr:hypothetical protein CCMSSC00406_0010128 [Pleurotus cornucopiae]
MVQPSVFQEVKSKRKEDIDNGATYRKDVESGLRRWIDTKDCRREEAAVYFNDGCERKAPTAACCDNCFRVAHPNLQSHAPQEPSINDNDNRKSEVTYTMPDDTEGKVADPSDSANTNGKRPLQHIPNRRDVHLQDARDLLKQWRNNTWFQHYAKQPWGIQGLLPDKVLNNIALHARSATPDDLKGEGWSYIFVSKHGTEVLNKLKDLDSEWHRKHADAKQMRNEMKKQETAKKRAEQAAIKKAKQEETRALRRAAPKTPRPSRAKRTQSENVPPSLTTDHSTHIPRTAVQQTLATPGPASFASHLSPLPYNPSPFLQGARPLVFQPSQALFHQEACWSPQQYFPDTHQISTPNLIHATASNIPTPQCDYGTGSRSQSLLEQYQAVTLPIPMPSFYGQHHSTD